MRKDYPINRHPVRIIDTGLEAFVIYNRYAEENYEKGFKIEFLNSQPFYLKPAHRLLFAIKLRWILEGL